MPPAAWQPSAVQPLLTARSPPGRFRGHHSPGSAFWGACACGKSPFSGSCKSFRRKSPSEEQFQFETLCIPNHMACHFAEKTRFFRLVLPGGAVPPPHIVPFSKIKRSIACLWGRRALRVAVDAGRALSSAARRLHAPGRQHAARMPDALLTGSASGWLAKQPFRADSI